MGKKKRKAQTENKYISGDKYDIAFHPVVNTLLPSLGFANQMRIQPFVVL